MQKGKDKEKRPKHEEQTDARRFLRRAPDKRKSSPNLLANCDSERGNADKADKLTKSPSEKAKTTKTGTKSNRRIRGRSQSSNALTQLMKGEVHKQRFVCVD